MYSIYTLTQRLLHTLYTIYNIYYMFYTHQVLILCPMRHVAYEVVCIMRALLGTAATFTNEERFEEEFGPGDEDEELSLPPVRNLLNFLFLNVIQKKHNNCSASQCAAIAQWQSLRYCH
jgi:hypothetical protein